MSDPDLPVAPLPRLLAIMARLRDPARGCPWDLEQTWDSIVPYTIEEAHEVADAISRRDWDDVRAELGDLLLQVVYFAQFGAEEGRFDFDSIAAGVADKMVTRHPHVFGDAARDKSAAEQTRDWERAKAAERQAAGAPLVLGGVALGLPALTRALKLQKRAARVGFDWPEGAAVLDKVVEEARELADAGEAERTEEFGDLLFSLVNHGRHLGLDPEAALRAANAKFARRFAAVEDGLALHGMSPADASLDEMDALWNAAKAAEKPTD